MIWHFSRCWQEAGGRWQLESILRSQVFWKYAAMNVPIGSNRYSQVGDAIWSHLPVFKLTEIGAEVTEIMLVLRAECRLMIIFPLLAVCVDLTMAIFINETASWSTLWMFVRWMCTYTNGGYRGATWMNCPHAALPCLDGVIFEYIWYT